MEKLMEISSCNFSLEFAGDEGIYVDTLSTTINSVIGIIKEITVYNEPEAFVKLKITKFDSGSFDIDFIAIVETAKTLISDGKMMASGIISILGSIFTIKKFLKGEKAKKIEPIGDGKVEIENKSGEVLVTDDTVVNTLFKNCQIDNLIVQMFDGVDKESGKTSLNVYDSNRQPIVSVTRNDYKTMKKPLAENIDEFEETYINNVTTNLLVRKPDLTGKSKWGFIFDRNIEATIDDLAWLEKVHKEKIAFCQGDRIKVDMTIEVNQDKNGEVILGTEKYIITKVYGDVIKESSNHRQIDFNDFSS